MAAAAAAAEKETIDAELLRKYIFAGHIGEYMEVPPAAHVSLRCCHARLNRRSRRHAPPMGLRRKQRKSRIGSCRPRTRARADLSERRLPESVQSVDAPNRRYHSSICRTQTSVCCTDCPSSARTR